MRGDAEGISHDRIPVAVLGATGSVGQRFVSLLADHPWFELVELAASERSAGRAYGDATTWMHGALPGPIAALPVRPLEPDAVTAPLVFSALDASVAGDVESAFAAAGRLVVTNARNHRMDPEVPLVVPEVNPDALELLARGRAGGGAIVANPNCSTIGLVLALEPLVDRFGLDAVRGVRVVTLQALSGAGRPTPATLDALANVAPFIPGEEEKLETETRKILGDLRVAAQCNRVPVPEGHLLSVAVDLAAEVDERALVEAWSGFRGVPQELELPSAPEQPVVWVGDDPRAPQPRSHVDLGAGMCASVGRLKRDPLGAWSFVTLSHNTVRGAAGGALLVAELVVARGAFPGLARS